MKIAVYKPWKEISFDDNLDNRSWSKEVTNFILMFAEHGHEIYILSSTDWNEYCKRHISITNNTDEKFVKMINRIHVDKLGCTIEFDYLVLFAGVYQDDEPHEDAVLSAIKAKKKFLYVTDLGIYEKCNKHSDQLYTKVLAQTTSKVSSNWTYGHLEKLWLYHANAPSVTYENRRNVTVFFGARRKRAKEILEYIVRPGVKWFGGSLTAMFGTANKATKNQLIDEFTHALWTMVIADPDYYTYGFVTQRYYEACIYGTVNLVSDKYDKYELVIKKDDPRRVSSYIDVLKKTKFTTPSEWKDMQQKQFDEVKPWLDGNKLYEILFEIMNK